MLDPLGLFTTVTLRAKLLLLELWEENKEWDDPVNETQLVQWKEILNGFDTLHTIKLPRFVGNDKCKLLCFSDPSGNAQANAVYLLTEIGGKRNIEIMLSKSRSSSPEVFCRKVLLEISQNSRENTCTRVSFLKRDSGTGVFL